MVIPGIERVNQNKKWITFEVQKINCVKNEISIKPTGTNQTTFWNLLQKQPYSDLLTKNKDNIKKTWQIMKDIVDKNKKKECTDQIQT